MRYTNMKNEEVKQLNPDDVKFVQVAGGGAQGDPGAIYCLLKNAAGISLKRGSPYDDFDVDALCDKLLPDVQIPFHIPQGWHWLDLGMDNHLYVRDAYYQDFMQALGSRRGSQIYQCWAAVASQVLRG